MVVGWDTVNDHQCERGYSCKYHLNGGELCLQEATGSLDADNQILESQKEEVRRDPSRGKEDPEGLISVLHHLWAHKLIPSFRAIRMKAVRDMSASEPWYPLYVWRFTHDPWSISEVLT